MGIYIPNMKMPKSCEDCPLVEETENYYGDTMSRECNLIYKGYISEAPKGGRLQGCPLVPLPEGHGRLGDLDALQEEFKKYHDGKRLMLIDTALTIVPAEGGSDDEHV